MRPDICQKDFERHNIEVWGNQIMYQRPGVPDSIAGKTNKKKFNRECLALGFPDSFVAETDIMVAAIKSDNSRKLVKSLYTITDETIKLTGTITKEATSTTEMFNNLPELHTTIMWEASIENTRRPMEVEEWTQSAFHKRQKEKAKHFSGGYADDFGTDEDEEEEYGDYGMDDGMFD